MKTEIPQDPAEVSNRTISTIWTVVATVSAYITLNTWAHTQGAKFDVPYSVFKDFGRYGALLFAIPVSSFLLIVSLWLAETHAHQAPAGTWHARLPRAFHVELDINVTSSLGIWYQRFFLLIYIVFPLCGLIHFARAFFCRNASTWDGKTSISLFNPDWNSALDSLAYKFHGESYFPAWQPWLYILILTLTFYRALCFTKAVFFKNKRSPINPNRERGIISTNEAATL